MMKLPGVVDEGVCIAGSMVVIFTGKGVDDAIIVFGSEDGEIASSIPS